MKRGTFLGVNPKYLKYFNQDIKKIKKYISKQNFSLDSKKPTNISNKSETFLRKVYACSKVSNNLIDIKTIDESFLKKVNWNLITYSFPCQDLSIAG
ncbi:MAG: DNA cytosine methyltransferase, partial [Mycoplasma sp.]|nr:DNA cytosine methyltransferase [Mycoplasma sp.]